MRLLQIHLILFISIILFPLSSYAIECINTKFLFDVSPGANQPSDIAAGPRGDIYIVDGVNNRIIVIDKNGGWKFAFGSEGSGKGQFRYPVGIDISSSGEVFIADSGNHRIQVFDQRGNFLHMFKVREGENELPPDPVDVIASDLQNYVYIADNDNHKIKVHKQNGSYEFEWGVFGEEYGQFRYPGMMTINEYNEIFVVDVLNTRVQKFDPFGKFINDIGSWGVRQGKLFRPKGVALDRKNRVFISDSYMGVIQAFTDMGRFVGVLCDKNKMRKFNTPVGILIDKKDKIFIVEMRGNKLTVLKILE